MRTLVALRRCAQRLVDRPHDHVRVGDAAERKSNAAPPAVSKSTVPTPSSRSSTDWRGVDVLDALEPRLVQLA